MEESAFQMEEDEGESDAYISQPGDRFKETGYSKDDSLTSIDIQEMERVRLSLQSMLKSSEHFLRDDDKTVLEASHRAGESRHKGGTDPELFNASIGTSVLLNNYVNADKQEVAMVSDSFDENSETMRRSRTKYDKSLVLENSILNESLEKERLKRRHCEAQIKDLQLKLLQTQQHLALSASGERKKDVMINQLDKTLARVVEDWKKHEHGKLDALGKLEEQREQDEQSQQRYQEMLAQFEKDLSQAVEALSREEERAANAEREKDSQIATVMEERNKLLQLLAMEREKAAALENQIQALKQKANKYEELGRLLDKEEHAWQEERSELESKIELINQAHVQDLENEKKLVGHEKQVAEDSQRVLSAVQKEVQQLTVQLDTSNREKENLKTEITLLAAKYEAQTTRQESEHRAELERQLGKNLREVQNQLTRNENEMRAAHKKQIEDLTKKYKNDLEDQLRNFHQQLKQRDRKLKETNEDYEEKLSKTHEQLVKTSSEREAVKNEKHKMVVRLQKMMQSHCEEALSLLLANTVNLGGENVLSDQHRNAPWITRQTPTLVTRAVDVGIPRESPHHVYNGDGRKSLGTTGNTSQRQARYSNQSLEHTQAIAQSADDLVHTWRRLSPMVAEPQQTEKHIPNFHETLGHPEHSYPQNDEIQERMGWKSLNDHSSLGEERNVRHTHQSMVKDDLQYQSDGMKGLHTTLSPSTTNESLDEQTMEEDCLESGKPNLPLNLSSDVLQMLHQQQSRQTELNHYVRQLLKKSPSSSSGVEMADSGQLSRTSLSVVRSDNSEPVISPIKEDNVKKDNTVGSSKISLTDHLSSASIVSKQMAFKKSAATPRRGFNSSRIPAPQTHPNKDYPSEKDDTTGNSTLTPEQVGQLARLIQMYQKDNEDVNLLSPQKMFQYLRDVQTRGEAEQRECYVDKREMERKTSLSESLDPALFSSKQVKKDSRTKRKLEVNIPPNNSKGDILTADPPLSEMGRNGPARKTSSSQDDIGLPARAPLTSESVLSSSRQPETRSKNKNTVTKPPKRASGKSTKVWK